MKTSKPGRPAAKKTYAVKPNAETKANILGERAPRLPHERDESASSQNSDSREIIEQAYADLQKGLVDTGTGPPMDAQYKRTLRPHKP